MYDTAETIAETGLPLAQLSAEARRTLAQQITGQFSAWKTQRSGLERTWQQCWDAYLCNAEGLYSPQHLRQPDRAKVVRPVLFECVESIHAHLMNSLFPSNEPFFSVRPLKHGFSQTRSRSEAHAPEPLGEESVLASSKHIESLMREQLERMRFREQFALFLKQAIVTGNSVAALPWIRDVQTIKQRKLKTLLGVPIGEALCDCEHVTREGAGFEVLDMADVVFDPTAGSTHEAKVIRRSRSALSALLSSGLYPLLEALSADELQTLAKGEAKSVALSPHQKLLGQTVSEAADAPTFTILEAWGDFEVDGELHKNYVATVLQAKNGGESRLIRLEPNPYHHGRVPFVLGTYTPVPGELYGLSPIEKCLGLQHAVNTLTNQKLDVINVSINNPFTYLINDDVFDPDTVVTAPGALIPVKSHDTLRPIQYLNNFTVAFTEIADLKQEVEETTGVHKLMKGASESGSAGSLVQAKSATEVSAMIAGGAQKFGNVIAHLESSVLAPYLQTVLSLMRQFMPLGALEMLNAPCAFEVTGSYAAMTQQKELDGLLGFAKLIQADAQLRERVDVTEVYRRIYRRLGLGDESGVFLEGTAVLTEERR